MSRLAALIGALALLAGSYIVYVNDQVLDPDVAGARASEALADDPELRAAIAPKVEDVVPDPIQDLPLVGGASASAVETALAQPVAADAFGNAVSSAVEELTRDDRPDPIVLNLTDVAAGVSSSPLDIVTDQVDTLQVDLSGADGLLDVLALAGELEPLGIPLLIVGFLLLLAAVLLAAGLADGLLAAGLSVGVASCFGIAALLIARTLLGDSFDDETSAAVVATWDALGGDLMMLSIVAAVAGFVVALGAWALRRRGGPAGPRPPRRRTSPHDETIRPGRATSPHAETIRPGRGQPPPPPPPPPRQPRPPRDPGDLPPDQDFGRRRYR